jgi:hypothetical protein
MKLLLLTILLCILPLATSFAGEVTPFRECATLRNAANQEVLGVIKTEEFKYKGQLVRHEGTFDLQDGETVNICSTGPFFPGYKVELTIKTIMPLFSCLTRLSGEIVLRRKEGEDGVNLLYADCK